MGTCRSVRVEAELEGVLERFLESGDIASVEEVLGVWMGRDDVLWAALRLVNRETRREMGLLECGVVEMWLRWNSERVSVEVVNRVVVMLTRCLLDGHVVHAKVCDVCRQFVLRHLYDSDWMGLLGMCEGRFCESICVGRVGRMLGKLMRLFGCEWLESHSDIRASFWRMIVSVFDHCDDVGVVVCALKLYRDVFLEQKFEREVVLRFVHQCLERCGDMRLWKIGSEIMEHLDDLESSSFLEHAMELPISGTTWLNNLVRLALKGQCEHKDLLVRAMVICASFGDQEMTDFVELPEIYYECAYKPLETSPRFVYRRAVQQDLSFWPVILKLPVSEALLWLIGAVSGVREVDIYLRECTKHELPLPVVATLLHSLSKLQSVTMDLLDYVLKATTCDHPVVITAAIRLLRKWLLRSVIEPSPAIINIIIANVTRCLTKDAVQILSQSMQTSPTNFKPLIPILCHMLESPADVQKLSFVMDCIATLVPHFTEQETLSVVTHIVGIACEPDTTLFADDIISLLIACLSTSSHVALAAFNYMTPKLLLLEPSALCDLSELFLYSFAAFGEFLPLPVVNTVVSAFASLIAHDQLSSEEKCAYCMVLTVALIAQPSINTTPISQTLTLPMQPNCFAFIYCQLASALILTNKASLIDESRFAESISCPVHNALTCTLLKQLGHTVPESTWIFVPESSLHLCQQRCHVKFQR